MHAYTTHYCIDTTPYIAPRLIKLNPKQAIPHPHVVPYTRALQQNLHMRTSPPHTPKKLQAHHGIQQNPPQDPTQTQHKFKKETDQAAGIPCGRTNELVQWYDTWGRFEILEMLEIPAAWPDVL